MSQKQTLLKNIVKFKDLWTDLWKSTLKKHYFVWILVGEKKTKKEV